MRRLVLAACLVSSTTGCAAVFKGGHQDVRFSGAPQGATVRIDGKYVGDLPTSASLDRDKPPNIEITSTGFQKQGVYLQKKADTPWFFWDIATCVRSSAASVDGVTMPQARRLGPSIRTRWG